MRAALVVHRVTLDMSSNMDTIKTALNKAANHGADLVLFQGAVRKGTFLDKQKHPKIY